MLRVVLRLLMTTAGLAFVPLAVLAAAGLADPLLAVVAFGVATLAMGTDEVAGWTRGRRLPPPAHRPTAWAGRVSSLGFGLVLVATGVVLMGVTWMPRPVVLAAVAVFVGGFALLLMGGGYDRRQTGPACGGPDAGPPAAADHVGM